MLNDVRLIAASTARLGIRYEISVVRALIPEGVIGAYLLLLKNVPIYAGRSDVCLRDRLINHHLLGVATHVMYQPCRDPFQAFCIEGFWFHTLRRGDGGLNMIHPARPKNEPRKCPFCAKNEEEAIEYAIQRTTPD